MDDREAFISQIGGAVNMHGGIYSPGVSYGLSKKIHVSVEYQLERLACQNNAKAKVSLNRIARCCEVGWHFVWKVRDELHLHGRVLRPHKIYMKRVVPRGPGSKTLDRFDKCVLMRLLDDDPSRSLRSYSDRLEEYTGKKVCRTTICKWFLHAFPIRGGMVKPNLVPYDKFRPENEMKAYEYLFMLSHFSPERVKFGDEKLLKGQDLYNRQVRVNPMTGVAAPIITDPDFRNTHSITGFCSIDPRTTPMWFRIHRANNNAEQFKADVEGAIASGFLGKRDILVLDNAAYHTGKQNRTLADWLWTKQGIYALFLPARTPEWNPIELVWATLVKRMKMINLKKLRDEVGTDCAAFAAEKVLSNISRRDIEKNYRHCYKGL